MELKQHLLFMFTEENENFEWKKNKEICDALKSFKKTSVQIRAANAGVNEAFPVIKILTYLTQTQSPVKDAIRPVLEKWRFRFLISLCLDGFCRKERNIYNEGEKLKINVKTQFLWSRLKSRFCCGVENQGKGRFDFLSKVKVKVKIG